MNDDMDGICQELRLSARRIEGPVQKHPSTGKGLLKRVQERYIAVMPDYEIAYDPEVTEFMTWKAGNLAWWETVEAFRTGQKPKGTVPLLKIAKVDTLREDKTGKSIVVKHKTEGIMHELILVFEHSRDAEEWSYTLWTLIALVRGEATGIR